MERRVVRFLANFSKMGGISSLKHAYGKYQVLRSKILGNNGSMAMRPMRLFGGGG